MPRPKSTPGHRDIDALVFLRRLVDHVESDPPPGLDLALASRARSELARLLDPEGDPVTAPREVTAETLTDEDIAAEMERCKDDKAQASSMIAECSNTIWPRRRAAAGMARIAAAINARAKAGR